MVFIIFLIIALFYCLGITAAYNYWAHVLHTSTTVMGGCTKTQKNCPSDGCEMGAFILCLVWPVSWLIYIVTRYLCIGLSAAFSTAARLGTRLSSYKGD